jgi:3-hydroxyisobutyrate dehydrogenase-like beta-hydroxyacid dehydrogenase
VTRGIDDSRRARCGAAMSAPAVALVGLGTMGSAIALRLLETGAHVVATSRRAGQRLDADRTGAAA